MANAAFKTAKAVNTANNAYETGSGIIENGGALAETASERDKRGVAKAAVGMALEVAGGKKADGALGAFSLFHFPALRDPDEPMDSDHFPETARVGVP